MQITIHKKHKHIYKYIKQKRIKSQCVNLFHLNYLHCRSIIFQLNYLHNYYQKFDNVSFSSSLSSVNINIYFSHSLDIINPSKNVSVLGIHMSSNCSFDYHINVPCKKN